MPAIDAIGYNNDRLLAQVVEDPWPIVNDLYQVLEIRGRIERENREREEKEKRRRGRREGVSRFVKTSGCAQHKHKAS